MGSNYGQERGIQVHCYRYNQYSAYEWYKKLHLMYKEIYT